MPSISGPTSIPQAALYNVLSLSLNIDTYNAKSRDSHWLFSRSSRCFLRTLTENPVFNDAPRNSCLHSLILPNGEPEIPPGAPPEMPPQEEPQGIPPGNPPEIGPEPIPEAPPETPVEIPQSPQGG